MKRSTILMIAALGASAAATEESPRDGAAVFKSRCARCHGTAGETDTPGARALKVRPLLGDAELARMAPPEIVKAMKADGKHQALRALDGVDDADLEAVAVFVKELAKKP